MAISPKAKYPAQINVADLAYPLGKARNVNTAGDGSGTPLEADWVNDVFGFEQALLQAVGATPSGTPDKVGASQYLDAIKTLITRLTTTANTWTKKQIWQMDNEMASNAILYLRSYGAIYWAIDTSYTELPMRTVMVPLKPVSASNWSFSYSNAQWVSTGTSTIYFLLGRDALPSGAKLVRVRAGVVGIPSSTLIVNQTRYDLNNANGGVHETEVQDTFAGGSPRILVANMPSVDTPNLWSHYNDTTQLSIRVNPGGTGLGLRWLALDYYDETLTNA